MQKSAVLFANNVSLSQGRWGRETLGIDPHACENY